MERYIILVEAGECLEDVEEELFFFVFGDERSYFELFFLLLLLH